MFQFLSRGAKKKKDDGNLEGLRKNVKIQTNL